MNESESKGKRDKDIILKRLAVVITITASGITIVAGILTIGDYVSKSLFNLFLVLTLLIILLLLMYSLVAFLFTRVLLKWKEVRKNKLIVKRYFDEFAGFSDRLGELLRDSRCDNVPYVFTHLRTMPPELNYPRSLIYDLASLLAVFKEAMEKVDRMDFRLLIKWFNLILRMYNGQLVIQPFRQIRNLYKERLTEHDRESYEKSRENYIRFLQDYMNFARAINKDFGENVAYDYFEPPGRLEKA